MGSLKITLCLLMGVKDTDKARRELPTSLAEKRGKRRGGEEGKMEDAWRRVGGGWERRREGEGGNWMEGGRRIMKRGREIGRWSGERTEEGAEKRRGGREMVGLGRKFEFMIIVSVELMVSFPLFVCVDIFSILANFNGSVEYADLRYFCNVSQQVR